MRATFVLMHSPLLGPASWRRTAHALLGAGERAAVPSLRAVASSPQPSWPRGVEAIVHSVEGEPNAPVVLVPHSNAGLFVPAVAAALGDRVRGVVFVDAALPASGPRSAPEFLERLADEDGLLPPWTSWWDEADIAPLFPDADVRAEVAAEQPRLPLAYYRNLPPVPDGWASMPCAYFWFGAPYDEEAARARALGWPVEQVPGGHLHQLVDPDAVAAAILRSSAGWV